MQVIIMNILLTGVLACVSHEGGHYLAAICFGKKLSFHFEFGKLFGVIPIPRWTWVMPHMANWKQKVVAVAGFGIEFVCALSAVKLGWPWMMMAASCHLLAYPFYAGESSDFKWL